MASMPRLVKSSDPAWTDTVDEAHRAFNNVMRLSVIRHLVRRGEPASRNELTNELGFVSGSLTETLNALEKLAVLVKTTGTGPSGRPTFVYSLDKARLDELTKALASYAGGE